ncbi:MAG: glutamate 5-kinase [Desulfobulbaceae bacterium]|uniref:Glutamate 5-kinase n=1 Tax=Candidatus Desulfatifera sulfidica TaxID=2841691 RepID=A0A8J6N7L4_9BACT|nr:glutamate 5-kinase [Candidatus Desulfatifera sulfidica]
MTQKISLEDGLYYRQTLFDKAKRVVIKVGSAILTDEKGMNQRVVDNIARDLSFLRDTGREVILVSSGAVAAGRKKKVFGDHVITSIREKQALAAIGQSCLMHTYDQAFSQYGQTIAQVLLTHSDLAERNRYLNVRNTILTLFQFGVIPIINENDTVCVEELRFGDNDTLGAMIANMIEADMFICLTDVECLYTGNPHSDPDASPVYTVSEVTPEIESMAGNVKSALGTGGMQTKIRAAKMVSSCGGSSFIGPGREDSILSKLFSGEMIGTFFLPAKEKIQQRKHWIGYILRPKGFLVLDDGARHALTNGGKSLLPSGIVAVEGSFGVGEPVHCVGLDHKLIAAGLVNYKSTDINKIKQRRSTEIMRLLGFKDSDEVVHRDNLVLL